MLQTVTREDDVSILTTRSPLRVDGTRDQGRARRAPHRRAQRRGSGRSSGCDASLKGMTWSHPRGYDPMVACSALWRERTGVAVDWDKRSLQDFEILPGRGTGARLRPDRHRPSACRPDHRRRAASRRSTCPAARPELAALAAASVGRSFRATPGQGRQWALADRCRGAGAGLAARPARRAAGDAGPRCWRSRGEGRVLLPLRPPHSLMVLLHACGQSGPALRG